MPVTFCCTIMATFELDPLFVKALGYLRSSNKDSVYHLKALLDDVIAGNSPGKSEVKVPDSSKSEVEEKKIFKKSDTSKREVEKRSNEKIKKDISDIFEPTEKKKPKLHVDRARKPVIEDDDDDDDDEDEDVDEEEEAMEDNDEHDEDEEEDEETQDADTNMEVSEVIPGSTDVGDFALELGLSCNVCKQISVSKGNQLFECQECHALYHQKCHKPFVSDTEINDPRVVWYCSRCSKSLKKMVAKKSGIKTVSSSSSTRDSGNKQADKKTEEPANIFKRSDSKQVSSPSSTSANQPFTGLASYAANLTGRGGNGNRSSQPGPSGGRPSSRERSNSMTAAIATAKPPSMTQISKGLGEAAAKQANLSKTASVQKQGLKTSSVDPYYKRMQMMKKKASKK